MLQFKNYKLTKTIVTDEVLNAYINNFWNDVFTPINKSNAPKHLLLMCKVVFTDSALGYRTLGHLRKVNYSDKELFINYLSERLTILNDSYTTQPISRILFTYIIKEGLAGNDRGLIMDTEGKEVATHRFNNMELPVTMDPANYGTIEGSTTFPTFVRYFVADNVKSNRNYKIDVTLDGLTNNVSIMGASDLKWVDTSFGEGFKREIGKSTIYFVNGEIVLRKQQFPAKPFSKGKLDRNVQTYFVTLDIETIDVNNKKVPYLITAFNGTDYVTSFDKDQSELFSSFINGLFNFIRSKTLLVYAHNLSGFDGIFLLRHLLSYGKVEPLIFNGKLISIKLIIQTGQYKGKTIIFKDSMLLLPLGLRKLCNAFGLVVPKGYFPFKLVDIFYTGMLPKFEYWTGIDLGIYESLVSENKDKIWSFKDNAVKYCKLDCACLHEILIKFNELIFSEFKIDAHKSLTLPSLAMRIYKANYMPKDTIYQLLGPIEALIRESYSGGAVDVYIPHNRTTSFFSKAKALFTRLYIYDANSLFPYIMATSQLPIGKPTYFEGDIRKVEPKAYGFFYCKITSPAYLDHPILQRRVKTENGIRTIAGLGMWYGWICTTEMDNAIKYGYEFEILSGYQFKTGDVFSEYITKMYNLRLRYVKGTPMNLIAKLLMNSLYGKFGMRTEVTKVNIFNTAIKTESRLLEALIKEAAETVQDVLRLDQFNILVVRDAILTYVSDQDDFYHGQDVNIAIASAITAGARVYMSYFKNNPNFNLYYSDTDSAAIDKELPESMIGNALGQFKLENVVDRAVFLAPKVYGLITEDGDEIIKVKGLTQESASLININELEKLLVQGSSVNISQTKWYKKVYESEITVQEIAYTLKVTSNKRKAIYEEGVFNNTKPFYYKEIFKNNIQNK